MLEERPEPGLDGERRRYYRPTELGRRVTLAEVERLEGLVRAGRSKGFVPGGHARGGPFGPRWGSAALLLLAVSARFYGELLVLYPKAYRRHYAAEMRQDFSEIVRKGLHDGGTTESVRVLAQAFWEPVLTALKERSTLLAG